jgi:hypothetical protein
MSRTPRVLERALSVSKSFIRASVNGAWAIELAATVASIASLCCIALSLVCSTTGTRYGHLTVTYKQRDKSRTPRVLERALSVSKSFIRASVNGAWAIELATTVASIVLSCSFASLFDNQALRRHGHLTVASAATVSLSKAHPALLSCMPLPGSDVQVLRPSWQSDGHDWRDRHARQPIEQPQVNRGKSK